MAKNTAKARRAVQLQLATKRWLHDVKRRNKKVEFKSTLLKEMQKNEFLRQKYLSKPLRLMSERCVDILPSDSARAGKVALPKIFSLHHNPQEVLRVLYRIARYAKSNREKLRIFVDSSRVVEMDLAADSLLAILLKEVKSESFNVRRTVIRGNYPKSAELRKEMDEIGAIKVLFSDPGSDGIDIGLNESVKVYRYRQTGVETLRAIDTSDNVETVTKKFADHVGLCLGEADWELTELGRKNLCDYVGELLTNAQDHAGFTDWTIVGYLDNKSMVFKMVVINFGMSFEESFLSLSEDSYAWLQIKNYVERHSEGAQRRFGMKRGALITVAALQSKISSKNLDQTGTRGQGTIAMLEFFQRIYDACQGDLLSNSCRGAEMALISGATHITFDGKYRLASDANSGREVIAFNQKNSLRELPDGRVVKSMPGVNFPGTIISISFPLTPEMQIREKLSHEHHASN